MWTFTYLLHCVTLCKHPASRLPTCLNQLDSTRTDVKWGLQFDNKTWFYIATSLLSFQHQNKINKNQLNTKCFILFYNLIAKKWARKEIILHNLLIAVTAVAVPYLTSWFEFSSSQSWMAEMDRYMSFVVISFKFYFHFIFLHKV